MTKMCLHQKQRFFLSQEKQLVLHILEMPLLELSAWLESQVEGVALSPLSSLNSSFSIEEVAQPPSLLEHLMQQAREHFDHPTDLEIAETIIGSLDHRGFLGCELSSLIKEKNQERAKTILERIQTFDPPGIAARDLRESLLIQLKMRKGFSQTAYRLVERHFDDLLHNRFLLLQKRLQLPVRTLKKIVKEEISSLNPYPASSFSHVAQPSVVVDLEIEEEGPSLRLVLNEDALPPEGSLPPLLQKALETRGQLLKKMGAYLIEKQGLYLLGKSPLTPITLQQAARDLGVHPSTMSRAVMDKYLKSPRGVSPLRDFFTYEILTISNEKTTHLRIKELLVAQIAKENKEKPFPDQELSEHLLKMGVLCARRTVAKYRQQLNIPPASRRKEWDLRSCTKT